MGEIVLPVCNCKAHDGDHVHVPHLIDSQYGLPVVALVAAEHTCDPSGPRDLTCAGCRYDYWATNPGSPPGGGTTP